MEINVMGKRSKKENSKLREMIKEYGIKDLNDVHEFVKMLKAETIQAALDAELENEHGYSKYDYRNKSTDNSRNGYSSKTVQDSMGEVELSISRCQVTKSVGSDPAGVPLDMQANGHGIN